MKFQELFFGKNNQILKNILNILFNIIQIVNGDTMINFEGINKFLLNINVDDVEVKEQINEMYYNFKLNSI